MSRFCRELLVFCWGGCWVILGALLGECNGFCWVNAVVFIGGFVALRYVFFDGFDGFDRSVLMSFDEDAY